MNLKYVKFEITPLSYVTEGDVLSTSVFQKSEIRSTGQQIEINEFDSDEFSHEWGSEHII